MNSAERKLEDINARLKHGEGWIGYRYHKTSDGQQAPSRFLYYSFYHGCKQKFVRTKTNSPERAYRELLAARKQVEDGSRLPS